MLHVLFNAVHHINSLCAGGSKCVRVLTRPNRVAVVGYNYIVYTAQKASIHQVTTMSATSKNVNVHNHNYWYYCEPPTLICSLALHMQTQFAQ